MDELESGSMAPGELAVENARLKARDVHQRHFARSCAEGVRNVILGVDTIVVLGGIVLSKPIDPPEARQMLKQLSDTKHQVLSGLCLIEDQDREISRLTSTEVEFCPISTDEIEWYLARGEYADKAGAYGIQGLASLFVKGVRGCYFNVVGLPVRGLYETLAELGIQVSEFMQEQAGGRDK